MMTSQEKDEIKRKNEIGYKVEELTEKQQRDFDELIKRYTGQTIKNQMAQKAILFLTIFAYLQLFANFHKFTNAIFCNLRQFFWLFLAIFCHLTCDMRI